MKSGFKAAAALVIVALTFPQTIPAAESPRPATATATATATAAPAAIVFTNKADQVSYSVGMYIANAIIKRNGVEVDVDVMSHAIKDVLSGGPTKLTEQQAQDTLRNYEMEMRARREGERMKLAEKNRTEGEKFLAANKSKEGVKVTEVKISETSMAEMQYKVLTAGTGEAPKAGDTVVVNMKGSLINGKEFENSMAKKGPVAHFPAGLREGLQMMKAGAKWTLYLPSSLAYGDFGFSGVEPGATVIYEVELLNVETPQPLTSDIIMVPSAEQMKAGSNFVTIKPEDAAKYVKTNAPAKPKKP